jgi:two-component system response regulator GlrR
MRLGSNVRGGEVAMSDPRTMIDTSRGDMHGAAGPNTAETAESKQPAIGRRQSDRLVAASASTQASLDKATACARSQSPVLIVGPSGSGRKHFGRAIHAWSSRSGGAFVVLSAISTPAGLQSRELFGSPDHSATTAINPEGALISAAQGTLLVDGIDRLDATVRAAFVQAMQTGSFRRPGQAEPMPATARIIATAESDHDKLLGDLPVQIVRLEGLNQRREDILPLSAHFLAGFAEAEGLKPIGFTSDARHWLAEESWQGNVRELRERIRQAVGLNSNGVISAEALMLATEGDDVPSFKEAKRAFETRYVEGLLRRCGGNISRAARLAKKDRKDFYDVIRRTGVDPAEFRS